MAKKRSTVGAGAASPKKENTTLKGKVSKATPKNKGPLGKAEKNTDNKSPAKSPKLKPFEGSNTISKSENKSATNNNNKSSKKGSKVSKINVKAELVKGNATVRKQIEERIARLGAVEVKSYSLKKKLKRLRRLLRTGLDNGTVVVPKKQEAKKNNQPKKTVVPTEPSDEESDTKDDSLEGIEDDSENEADSSAQLSGDDDGEEVDESEEEEEAKVQVKNQIMVQGKNNKSNPQLGGKKNQSNLNIKKNQGGNIFKAKSKVKAGKKK